MHRAMSAWRDLSASQLPSCHTAVTSGAFRSPACQRATTFGDSTIGRVPRCDIAPVGWTARGDPRGALPNGLLGGEHPLVSEALGIRHRKLMPTAMERIIWGFGDGSTLTVLPTPLGRIGAVVCWENYMPQLRLAMYAQGIELYCAPTVDDRETWLLTMRHIALEGRCFVLSANQYALRSDYPIDYPVEANNPGAVLIRGGSCIVDPFGQVLAGPARDGETLLTADLDLGQVARGKFDLDVVGHYARPDIFRLVVNETAQAPVPWESAADGTHDSRTRQIAGGLRGITASEN